VHDKDHSRCQCADKATLVKVDWFWWDTAGLVDFTAVVQMKGLDGKE
jgi:hypothetical protein